MTSHSTELKSMCSLYGVEKKRIVWLKIKIKIRSPNTLVVPIPSVYWYTIVIKIIERIAHKMRRKFEWFRLNKILGGKMVTNKNGRQKLNVWMQWIQKNTLWVKTVKWMHIRWYDVRVVRVNYRNDLKYAFGICLFSLELYKYVKISR